MSSLRIKLAKAGRKNGKRRKGKTNRERGKNEGKKKKIENEDQKEEQLKYPLSRSSRASGHRGFLNPAFERKLF